jgi:hypothetical protein
MGGYLVTLERPGYATRQLATGWMQFGDSKTLDVELHPLPPRRHAKKTRAPGGRLTVRTVPWSKVYDGARLLGTTPLAGVPLGAGSHQLKFVNPDLPPVRRTVDVRVGEETKLSLELK